MHSSKQRATRPEGPSEARRASRSATAAHGFAMRSAFSSQVDSRSETRIDARDLFDDDDLKTTGAATQCAWTPSSATGPEEHSVSAGDAVVDLWVAWLGRAAHRGQLVASPSGPWGWRLCFGTLARKK